MNTIYFPSRKHSTNFWCTLDARYQEYLRYQRRRRDEGRREGDSSSGDEDEEGSKEPLALEAAPERSSSR